MQFGFTDRLTCPVRYPNLIYLAILLEKRSNYKFQNHRGSRRTRTFEARRRGIYSPLQLPLCDTPKYRMACLFQLKVDLFYLL